MTRNRIYFGMLILILASIIVWTSYSMFNVGKKEDIHSVSVIVNNSNSDRWIALRQGLEQAAKDYNIDLNYVSTGELASVEEELALVNREVENGAEGIILQMVSSEEQGEHIAELSGRTAVLLLESDIKPEGVLAFAGPDNYELGMAVADAVKQELEGAHGETAIGILCGNQSQLSMQQRLQGLTEGLDGESVEIAWTLEKGQEQTDETLGLASVDIIIALGNDETEQMVDYLQAEEGMESDCLLYGVGCSEKAVYYLDKGVIKTLVVPNEFNMGYQSMEAVAKQIYYHLTAAEDSRVDYLVIDRTNLYDAENQKVLFPIVQ